MMRLLKNILFLPGICLMTLSFSKCGSTHNILEELPAGIEKAYYISWETETKDGGSGIDLVIPYTGGLNKVQLDSVYFRGKVTKLVLTSNGKAYIGQFKKRDKYSEDIIMSNEPGAEYGNKVPEFPVQIPFDLNPDECVVSYKKSGRTRYFKISDIVHKKDPSDSDFLKPIRQ